MLKTVQRLCRSLYGVTAVTRESYGCVWHLQHRRAGDDLVEVPLGWMSGAIVSDHGMISKIRARCPMRNRELYNSLTGRSAIALVGTGPPDRHPA